MNEPRRKKTQPAVETSAAEIVEQAPVESLADVVLAEPPSAPEVEVKVQSPKAMSDVDPREHITVEISNFRANQAEHARLVQNGDQFVAFIGAREVGRVNIIGGQEAAPYGGAVEYAKHRLREEKLSFFVNVLPEDILKLERRNEFLVVLNDGSKYAINHETYAVREL